MRPRLRKWFPWLWGYSVEYRVVEHGERLGYFGVDPDNMHIDALLLDIEQSAGTFNSDPGEN